jgi:hypothetical protein
LLDELGTKDRRTAAERSGVRHAGWHDPYVSYANSKAAQTIGPVFRQRGDELKSTETSTVMASRILQR